MTDIKVGIPRFGDCLRMARLAVGLAKSHAAKGAGIHWVTYSRIEGSEDDGGAVAPSPAPTWPNVYRIIVGLSLDLGYFFPERLILQSAERIRRRKGKRHATRRVRD